MSDSRPQAAEIQDHLDEIAKLYPAARDLTTGIASSAALEDFTTGGGFADLSSVINLALSERVLEFEAEVLSYARMLDDAGRTPPKRRTTVALIGWLKIHIGFFTHGDDSNVAWEFLADVERWHKTLASAADPSWTNLDTGEPCAEEGCQGTYRIAINRDKPIPYDLALDVLRGKDARCSDNGEHVMLVELLPSVRRWVGAR